MPDNYWYVCMISIDNFAVDDENYEKIKAAKMSGSRAVEIVDLLGTTMLIDPHFIARIDESTPAFRDAVYLWNKGVDEEGLERRRRLGVAERDFDEG